MHFFITNKCIDYNWLHRLYQLVYCWPLIIIYCFFKYQAYMSILSYSLLCGVKPGEAWVVQTLIYSLNNKITENHIFQIPVNIKEY